jgi:hypothetical protein
VTGSVCEKIAQNVAQPIFCQLNRGGRNQPKCGLLLQFSKTAQSKQSSNEQKFAKSVSPWPSHRQLIFYVLHTNTSRGPNSCNALFRHLRDSKTVLCQNYFLNVRQYSESVLPILYQCRYYKLITCNATPSSPLVSSM